MRAGRHIAAVAALGLLAGCSSSSNSTATAERAGEAPAPGAGELPYHEPPFPSAEWTTREAANYARAFGAVERQGRDPNFLNRWQTQSLANRSEYSARSSTDPYWDSSGNACNSWSNNCTGDPYRYPGVDSFYEEVGEVIPVSFYDQEGARISGRVWAPRHPPHGGKLPAVVILNGSVQAPETMYWWAAQLLVEQGYVVMSFDPRGQGRSENRAPNGAAGGNANSRVFRINLIDAIDFFYSTPDAPYVHNLEGSPGHTSDGGQAPVTPYNPYWDRFDRERFGVAGHSLGAQGVSVVQGEQPWPGKALADNPIKAVVAWDNLSNGTLDGVTVAPRVPAMGQSADYHLTPYPYARPPDPEAKHAAFNAWREAGVPAYQVNIAGGTHYEWSLVPGFPTSDWEPGGEGGWGLPLARHYTLAWFDRWLKRPGEPGYADADARLQNDAAWRERLSFYHPSRRSYPARDGVLRECLDLRRGC